MLGADAGEAAVRAVVAVGELGGRGQGAGQQAAHERREGQEADAELLAGREHLVLDAALEQRVLALHAGDRVHRSGAAQVGRQRLGEADEPDLPLLDQLRERADGLLDRRLGVDAVLLVEVDGLDAEAAQARLTRLAHVLGAAVDARRAAVGVGHEPELGREHDLVAAVADGAAHELLVVPGAVDVGGVEQVDAEVERAVDRRDAVGLVRAAVRAGHRHAAQADRRDVGAHLAELPHRDRHPLDRVRGPLYRGPWPTAPPTPARRFSMSSPTPPTTSAWRWPRSAPPTSSSTRPPATASRARCSGPSRSPTAAPAAPTRPSPPAPA